MIRLARSVALLAAARVALVVIRTLSAAVPAASPMVPPPPVIPPVGDAAEEWLQSLCWHHGPDERCNFLDCYPCWVASHEAAD